MLKPRALASAFSVLSLVMLIGGCHRRPPTVEETRQAKAAARAQADLERQQMEMVPPPSKNRYMAVHSFDAWENPYLTIQPNMVEVHILLADPNAGALGSGGMLRPTGARRQVVDIGLDKLAEAMTSIPQGSWPYGRVIAIEEAHKTPKAAEPAVRRNMESALGTLNDLGIQVYDINEGSLR